MTTTYTIPNRPSGADTRSISAILADFDAILAAINSYDGSNVQAGTIVADGLADAAKLGLSGTGATRRGKSIIATSEARTNVAFGTLTTPDRIADVVLPSDGLIVVLFDAIWQESVANAGRAAIFLDAVQMQTRARGAVGAQAARTSSTAAPAATDTHLSTAPVGLVSHASGNVSAGAEVTTGMAVAADDATNSANNQAAYEVGATEKILQSTLAIVGGPLFLWAAAGTYDVSVQFKSSSGSVTAKNRRLWVWTIAF